MASQTGTNLHTALLLTSSALVFGAANSFLTKLVLEQPCDVSCFSETQHSHVFSKPLFVTFVAFLSMIGCITFPLIGRTCTRLRARITPRCSSATSGQAKQDLEVSPLLKIAYPAPGRQASAPTGDAECVNSGIIDIALSSPSPLSRNAVPDPLDDGLGTTVHNSDTRSQGSAENVHNTNSCMAILYRRYVCLAVPAGLDVVATAMQAAAMLFISAAMNATMRGSLLLFTALASAVMGVSDSHTWLIEKCGIGGVMAGVFAVGAVGVLASGAVAGELPFPTLSPAVAAAIGISLSVASNIVMASQIVFETKYLELGHLSPNQVNVGEGVLGTGFVLVLLGICQGVSIDGQPMEDSTQTLCCLHRSPSLWVPIVVLAAAFMLSTEAHMALSLHLGSNYRSMILVARAVLVWLCELVTFAITGTGDGQWTQYSPLELTGFIVLCIGGALQTWGRIRRVGVSSSSATAIVIPQAPATQHHDIATTDFQVQLQQLSRTGASMLIVDDVR